MPYQELDDAGQHKNATPLQRVRFHFEKFISLRENRKLILFIVFVALFLDNMLLTTVVPVIPDYLWNLKYGDFNGTAYCLQHHLRDDQLSEVDLSRLMNPTNRGKEVAYSRGPSAQVYHAMEMGEDENFDGVTPDLLGPNASCHRHIRLLRHMKLAEENIEVGLMFASKSVVQLITNPFIGPLTNKIGYSIPMFSGFVIMFASTIIFAFGESYSVLFLARAVQGIGSACSSVSGMGMLATLYTDDAERGRAFGITLSGLALGVLVGPSFGGVLYQIFDKKTPFLLLAFLALFDGVLQIVALKPSVRPEAQRGASLLELLRDPYILIAAGSITFGNMGIAMLEPSLPLWMKETMRAEKWQQGIAFLPCSVSYLLGTNLFGHIAHKMGRWLSAGAGMVLGGICLVMIPFSKNLGHMLIPNFGLGFSIGMVDASMMPIMGYLVDLRHVSVYGTVYAISDVAFCLGFAIGPVISAGMVRSVGFPWLIRGMAIVCVLYSPLTIFLRNPPGKDENAIREMVMNKEQVPKDYATYSIDEKSPKSVPTE